MKKNIVFLFVLSGIVAGCGSYSAYDAPVEYAEYTDDVEYQTVMMPYDYDGDASPSVSMVKYSVPDDGDLTLETRHHIIQIQGAPNAAYEYRVWAGNKTYDDDPDLIVSGDDIMVLQTED